MSHCCTLKTKRKNTMHHMSLWMWCWKENSRFPVKVSILEIMNIYSSDRPQWRVTRETMSGWKLHLTNEIFIASRSGRPHCGFINCIFFFCWGKWYKLWSLKMAAAQWTGLRQNKRSGQWFSDMLSFRAEHAENGETLNLICTKDNYCWQGTKKPANTEEKENIILE